MFALRSPVLVSRPGVYRMQTTVSESRQEADQDQRCCMKSLWTKTILVSAAMMLFSLSPSPTIAQNANTNRNATAKGQMKSSGQEARSASVGLGKDVRHGHVVHGTRHFGRHTYRAGKHF